MRSRRQAYRPVNLLPTPGRKKTGTYIPVFFVWHSCMHMYDGTYMTTAIIYNCNIPIVMTAGQFICGCVSADLSAQTAMPRY